MKAKANFIKGIDSDCPFLGRCIIPKGFICYQNSSFHICPEYQTKKEMLKKKL